MPLQNNHRYQLADRLKADLQIRFPGYTITQTYAAGGALPNAADPLLTIVDGASTTVAVASITQFAYNGFNVVAELSSSAAQGLPEHILYTLVLDTADVDVIAKLFMAFKELGTAMVQFGFDSTVNEAGMTASALSFEWANTARYGASGQ